MDNTNIVVGSIDDEQTYSVERITTDLIKTSLECAVSIKGILEIYRVNASKIGGAIISSVVPPLNAALPSAIKKILDFRPRLADSGMKIGLNIHMDNPRAVGSNLTVGAVTAIREYLCPLITTDMGAAATICTMDADSSYVGDIIYLGLKISPEILSGRTTQLPNISLDIPLRITDKNTIDCMRNDIMYDNAGMLDDIIDRTEQGLGAKTAILATDDLSHFITSLCRHTIIYEKDLMLKRLLVLYSKNK